MAKAILMRGGRGGVSSDEVTAKREHVIKGHTTITADSNDEIVEGLIEDRGDGAVAAFAIGREDWNHQIWATFRNGWYHRAPHPAGHEAYIFITYEALANLLGIDPARMLESLTVADRRGQIKIIDTGLDDFKANKQNSSYGIDLNKRTFYIDFPHGNAYYTRGDGHPHTCIDADKLGNADAGSVLEWVSATSEKGVKFAGTIPRWICNTGDVISANNGDGHAWDDIYAGRGRGIIVGIKNGHYIQGAGWVFLPSPNLYPQNIRAGVNINGVVGTMPDYSAGRVVFNGATFDGILASGVASKGFMQSDDYYAYVAADRYGYGGIYDGGMNLLLRTDTPVLRGRKIGCVLSQSINLTPFRQIIIDYRPKATMANNPLVSLGVFISRASDVKRGAANVQGVGSVDGLGYLKGIGNKGYQGQLILDVSDVNEHAFLAFTAKADISSNRQVFNGAMQITKIEFVN